MSLGTRPKKPTEKRRYTFDFGPAEEIIAGATLQAPLTVASSPSGLTISGETINGDLVQFFAAGGTDGVDYHITCTVATSGGGTIVECGVIRVADC